MPLHIATPLLESRCLGLATRRSVWLKLEALQPPGSFKIRGIGAACEAHLRAGARRFVSSSGGNAGLAVAYAGRQLSVPVTVVVPQSTSARARALLRLEGAQVIVHGPSWQEANVRALSLLAAGDAFIHPFDDPLLWHGHASLIDEIACSGLLPDAIVLAVGGGGLLAGVIEGLRRNRLEDVPVIAVETAGADSLNRSLRAGHVVELEAITSVATSLGAKRVCQQAFACSRAHPVHSVVVSDLAALNACRHFLADHRLLVEPACGASLALAYDRSPALADYSRLLFVVCGGATASLAQICQWSRRLRRAGDGQPLPTGATDTPDDS
ncbi:MAG TPA: pyridoxal-phosphate dependent enzyme [Candidatus Accumulibacter phosphatis]|nr:MAG: Phenylserine dehydratase [Candidatus Accumulibacter sp. SK-11]HAY29239.1 serine dehydratase [Accumulibacter sp.]HRL75214.1 pyridoxal-phosphate dependent enzyme [Candidatus Accumulibacter phosphatis]HCN67844.1 serine dehydratase [Accumulibacter sp.]HCV13212.1 serine dehydratase [Accumulibacter sp.]